MQNRFEKLATAFDGDISSADKNVISAICSEPWAITEEGLDSILAIVCRLNPKGPDALDPSKANVSNGSRYTEIIGDTAIISIIGPIARYSNMFSDISGAATIDGLTNDFNAALANKSIDRIILNMDSPGGQLTGISEFAALIKESSKEKQIITYVSGMCASAAYWIASQSSKIIASDTAIVGSIGVIMTSKEGQDKGLIKIKSSQSPHKQASAETSEGKALLQVVVDELASVFINAVASGRGVSEKTVLADFGKGGVLVGANAIDAGMVDSVGSLNLLITGKSGLSSEVFKMETKDKNDTPVITLESVKVLYPAIAQQLIAEGANTVNKDALIAEGMQKGQLAENERIKGIDALLIPGHESLIAEMKLDGKCTVELAAQKIIAAEKVRTANVQKAIEEDATGVIVPITTASDDEDSKAVLSPKQAWEKMTAEQKKEYQNDFEIFEAAVEAEEDGLVTIYENK